MRVSKTEDPEGNLVTIELTNSGDENFKAAIAQWIQQNYPDWGHEGFFQRLTMFQANSCIISL